jgi:hypothetical protein
VVVKPDAALTLSVRDRLRCFQPSRDWLFEGAAASFGERTFAVVLRGVSYVRHPRNSELQTRKVRPMVEKFMGLSTALVEMGQQPLRVLTDITSEPFWTIVVEANVEKIDDFFVLEQKLMANESVRKSMGDYHSLIDRGRSEIYRLEP